MLYQLSYASPAQTLKNYHTGHSNCKGLFPPSTPPARPLQFPRFPAFLHPSDNLPRSIVYSPPEMKRAFIVILLLAAVAAGVWYIHQRAPRDGAAAEMLARFPGDAALYAYADLAALRNSPFLQHLATLSAPVETEEEYAAFVRDTGFDYTRDLERIALATYNSPQRLLVLAEGRFDHARITSYALRTGRSEQQNGREVYVVPGAEPGRVTAFTFLDEGRILLSDARELPALRS